MYADEILEQLRDPENCDVLDYIDDAADLIDSLTTQLTDYHHMEKLVDGKMTENQRLRKINENLQSRFAASQRREKAAVEDIRQACTTCMHSGKPSCPWEGTYHHRGEHGEKIGVCNAWQWRGARKEQNDG